LDVLTNSWLQADENSRKFTSELRMEMDRAIQSSDEARRGRKHLKKQARLHELEVKQAREATAKADHEMRKASQRHQTQLENPEDRSPIARLQVRSSAAAVLIRSQRRRNYGRRRNKLNGIEKRRRRRKRLW